MSVSKVLEDAEIQAALRATKQAAMDTSAETITALFKENLVKRGQIYPGSATVLEVSGTPGLKAGELALVKGQQGSRKSALIAAIVAAWLSNESVLDIKCFAANKNILWIDTEQGAATMESSLNRACALAQCDGHPENLDCADISEYEDDVRLEMLNAILGAPQLKKYGLVILDGGADFIPDINDQKAAKSFWQDLTRIGKETGACIITVIHENIGLRGEGGKASGWIGTIGEKKAALVWSVNIDPDNRAISSATITKQRHSMPPAPIRFWMDGAGRDIVLRLESEKTPPVLQSPQRKKIEKSLEQGLSAVIAQLSISGNEIQQRAALKIIQSAAGCQESTAKKLLKTLVEEGFLIPSKGAGNSNVLSKP